MDIKEIEKVVGSLQTHLFRNSNSFSVGMLKSHFKGSGLQFKEHQVYAPGDDVRFIDWKLSAKSNNTFVKTFEEERNVEIIIVLDLTASMLLGYKGTSKLEASLEIACLLYLLAEKSKDKVKAVVVSEKVTTLPALSGQKGIILLVSFLEQLGVLKNNGKPDIDYDYSRRVEENRILAVLKSFVAKNKEVVFLSDFSAISDVETLNKLIYRRNMHCFKISSPVDDARKAPFSVFAKKGRGGKLMRSKSKNIRKQLQGRWKKINVNERYLESFVKEML
jgi:uncharacterized protein (DUF58 family)